MTAGSAQAAAVARTALLRRRVRWIVGAAIGYNAIEAVVALSAGAAASSSALIGFGLDSIVEVLSAAAIAWQFAGGRNHEEREKVALRIIALSFFALAAFVTLDSVRALTGAAQAEHSAVGIALAAVSLMVMPGLSALERRTGRELGSASVMADSRQLLLCSGLSAVLLGGLLANSVLGWSWADPIAALVIAGVAVREGREAWKGDGCCSPVAVLVPHADAAGGCDADGCIGGCCAVASIGTDAPPAWTPT